MVTRLGKASRAIGCLLSAIFQNHRLSVNSKHEVYRAVVLSTLLYGADLDHEDKQCEESERLPQSQCMLGSKQWKRRITLRELAKNFGMTQSMAKILQRHCLRWLRHMAQIDDNRMPKQLIFGELTRTRPRHGTKREWRDLAWADVQAAVVDKTWYQAEQDWTEWKKICR